MQQARYFCSGTVAPSDYLHYGLAAPIYTHFTSPIRRYADLHNQHVLFGTFGAGGLGGLGGKCVVDASTPIFGGAGAWASRMACATSDTGTRPVRDRGTLADRSSLRVGQSSGLM